MRIRIHGLALLMGLSIVAAACGPGAGSSAPASVAPGSDAPSESAATSGEPSVEPSVGAGAELKIGVVTDVGTVNDKNFNEYTFVGAKEGAAAIGAVEPPVVVPTSDADYGPMVQAYVDQDFDIVVSTGFNLLGVTAAAAKANPETWFIGVDHDPCLTETGDVDPNFGCAGDPAVLLPKYVALNYQEDQAGYLAGIAAASATQSNIIGAVGGVSLCGPCIRYIQGYILGAQSVNPDITVKVAWVSDSDFRLGFADQAAGKTFTQQFIQQNAGIDVIFQVAGLTGNGVVDAACEAEISAVGVDVDQYQSYPAAKACILTSAEKKLAKSVSDSIQAIANGTAAGGKALYSAENDGIGVSPFYEAESKLAEGTQAKVDEAFAAMKAGSLITCPADACGQQSALPLGT